MQKKEVQWVFQQKYFFSSLLTISHLKTHTHSHRKSFKAWSPTKNAIQEKYNQEKHWLACILKRSMKDFCFQHKNHKSYLEGDLPLELFHHLIFTGNEDAGGLQREGERIFPQAYGVSFQGWPVSEMKRIYLPWEKSQGLHCSNMKFWFFKK